MLLIASKRLTNPVLVHECDKVSFSQQGGRGRLSFFDLARRGFEFLTLPEVRDLFACPFVIGIYVQIVPS